MQRGQTGSAWFDATAQAYGACSRTQAGLRLDSDDDALNRTLTAL